MVDWLIAALEVTSVAAMLVVAPIVATLVVLLAARELAALV